MAIPLLPSTPGILIAILLLGCEHPQKPVRTDIDAANPVAAIASGSPSTVIALADASEPNDADIPHRHEYYIQILKPDPLIDYKIMQIAPDPEKKYFIRKLGIEDLSVDRDAASPDASTSGHE